MLTNKQKLVLLDELDEIKEKKRICVRSRNYTQAAIVRDKEKKIMKELDINIQTDIEELRYELKQQRRINIIKEILKDDESNL